MLLFVFILPQERYEKKDFFGGALCGFIIYVAAGDISRALREAPLRVGANNVLSRDSKMLLALLEILLPEERCGVLQKNRLRFFHGIVVSAAIAHAGRMTKCGAEVGFPRRMCEKSRGSTAKHPCKACAKHSGYVSS